MWPNLQFAGDLVTFTEETLNGKFHFFCVVCNEPVETTFALMIFFFSSSLFVTLAKTGISHVLLVCLHLSFIGFFLHLTSTKTPGK